MSTATLHDEPDKLLDSHEAGELLGVSAWTMCEWARKRTVPAIRLGKFWRFRRSSLLEWLEQLERPAR